MSMNIIIAGSDSVCCSEIKSIIQSHLSDPPNLSVFSGGKELLEHILSEDSEVVICDAALPDVSCFEIMQRVSVNRQNNTRFILYGNRDFDAVYKALKFGAIDYLLHPVSPDSLKVALDKLSSLRSFTNIDNASRLFYIEDRGMNLPGTKQLSVDQVNQMYGTSFTEGLFRMIFVKYDAVHAFERLNKYTPIMLDKTDDLIRRDFEDICADIIITQKGDGAMAVLNYQRESSALLELRIQEFYNRIRRMARVSWDIDVTVCISAEIDDPCNVWQIKEQVRDAEWSRMVVGTNKIIFWKKSSAAGKHDVIDKLNRIFTGIKYSLESLDTERFKAAVNEYYKLPEEILLTREARMMFKQFVVVAFEMYWDTIAEFTDPAKTQDDIAYYSHLCTTFTRHRDVFISEYTKLIQSIAEQTDKKHSLPISNAINYVLSNIDKPMSLQLVADVVHLSQGYFSHLFKQETGLNFTKYVAKQKNIYACELLTRTDLTISEVAFRTGFSDVRAFSKQFRAANNTTPSRYRQLHVSNSSEMN